MPTVLIVADDLTGAADASVTFVEHGLSGSVILDATRAGPADVIAVNTDSRRLPSDEASARVRTVIGCLTHPHDRPLTFKKVDSTLRGHIGEELAAAMTAWDANRAIVAPAFPAMGRTMEHGVLRVAQRDAPHTISLQVHLPTLLASQGIDDCRLLAAHSGALQPRTWAHTAQAALDGSTRVVVCDCACDADLDAIVDAAWAVRERVLWVGSAGLAGALARRGASASHRGRARPARLRDARQGSVLFWIGSNQTVTLAQRQRLLTDGAVRVVRVSAADSDALSRHLSEGRHLLVDAGPEVREDLLRGCAQMVAKRDIAGFVISGGYTAARLCQLLGADRIDLGGEVSTGIPWGWLRARSGQCWPVVLKAGGFGGEDALVEALRFLTAHVGPTSRV
jgi:uncharacterized protein YgbK (DUF1537 family)